MGEFDPKPMRRLEERENIVDVLLSGYPIDPPVSIENFTVPGAGGVWPQMRLEIVGEFGKGEQIVYWNDAQDPPYCVGASAYASRWIFVYVPSIETYFTVAFIQTRSETALSPLASLFGGEPAKPQVDRMFVVRRYDAAHLADRFRPVIREDDHDYQRIRTWLSPYIPI